MPELSDLYDAGKDGVVLRVHVQPGAGKSAVVGRHGDSLKVRVAAPPVGGRANEATLALVADALGLASADVELTAGESSRSKRIKLRGIEPEEADKRLRLAIDGARPIADRQGSGH